MSLEKVSAVGGAVVLAGLFAAGAFLLLLDRAVNQTLALTEPQSLTINAGATLRPVLADVAKLSPNVSVRWVYWYARSRGETQVVTGVYEIKPGQTVRQVLAMVHQGEVKLETFTLPDGLNRWQVRDKLVAEKWMTPAQFDQLCDDQTFLHSHGIPGPSCDGYLFPETYTWARGLAARKILVDFFDAFKKALSEVVASGSGPLQLETRALVTLASIVEKETGNPQDRGRIACVFYNRLRAKPIWRLDSDPTVIYAATLADPSFDGNLTHEHLRGLDSPYNTYRITGLPPGPIANPGKAALDAVVRPAACKDFFFVSMNNGQSVFCPTLTCHNQAVRKWQVDYFHKKKASL